MKIVLITPTPRDIAAFGTRSISAYLKEKGHDVRVIFLPIHPEYYRDKTGILYGDYQYSQSVHNQILQLTEGCDLIGISVVMTQYYVCMARLSDFLRKHTKVPVVWGGVHATVKPEQSLAHAGMVCIGEGEEAMCELADRLEKKEPWQDLQNICYLENGTLKKNPVRPLIQDLDALPFLDYGPEEHFILDVITDTIIPFNDAIMENSLPLVPYVKGKMLKSLSYFTTRGCPFSCTYCVNDFYRKLYGSKGYVRKLSVDRMVAELEHLVDKFPFIEMLEFCDDNFALRPAKELSQFSEKYKKTINLPFQISVSPTNITREKMDPLVDAGLVMAATGIQSAAEVSEKLYQRKMDEKIFMDAVKVLRHYEDRIFPPCYHLILDNPFESLEDQLETFHFTLKLPRPFWFKIGSLVAFPGTEIYRQYMAHGLVKDEVKEIYCKILEVPSSRYLNFLYFLNHHNYPKWLLRFLSKKERVEKFNTPEWTPFFGRLEDMIRVGSKLGRWIVILLKGDINSIKKRIKRVGKVKRGWLTSSEPPTFL